jgi:hypothetical protein
VGDVCQDKSECCTSFCYDPELDGTKTCQLLREPEATPLPDECTTLFPVTTVVTLGQGDFSENNFQVQHFITGNIDPLSIRLDTNKVPVCRGTNVSIVFTDLGGTPSVSARTSGIKCETAGNEGQCTITAIAAKQRYQTRSSNRKDTDNMQIQIIEDMLPKGEE